jgi:hypothetical protein
MKCKDAKLIELHSGELSQHEAKRVLQHVEGCHDCLQRMRIMTALEDEIPSQPVRRGPHRLLLVAAGIALAFLVPLTHYVGNGDSKTDWSTLATTSPHPYFRLSTRSYRGPEDEDRPRWETAFSAYLEGDYELASRRFNALENNPEIEFYRGVSEYLCGNDQTARAFLENAASSVVWKAPSLWYQANLLLRTGNLSEAKQRLLSLQQLHGEYFKEATELLAKLESDPKNTGTQVRSQ